MRMKHNSFLFRGLYRRLINTKYHGTKTKTSKTLFNKHRRHSSQTENSSSENDLSSSPQEPKPVHIDKAKLREDSLQRAKKRPIRERILAFFRALETPAISTGSYLIPIPNSI